MNINNAIEKGSLAETPKKYLIPDWLGVGKLWPYSQVKYSTNEMHLIFLNPILIFVVRCPCPRGPDFIFV